MHLFISGRHSRMRTVHQGAAAGRRGTVLQGAAARRMGNCIQSPPAGACIIKLYTISVYTVWKRCGIGHSGCFRTKIRVSRVRKLNFDLINLFLPASMVRYHRNWYFRTLATGIFRQKSHAPFMSYPNILPTICRSARTYFYFSDHRKIKRRTSYKTDGMSIISPVSKLLLSRAVLVK